MDHPFLMLLVVAISSFCSETLQATLEEAEQDLQELNTLTGFHDGDLHLFMNSQADILRNELIDIQASNEQEIRDTLHNLTRKIENMANSTGDAADVCLRTAQQQIEEFATELYDRSWDCYGDMIQTGNSMLYSSWAKVLENFDIHYRCSEMSLLQCQTYNSQYCFDYVVSYIDTAKKEVNQTFEILKVEMANKISGISIPCQKMIQQELVFYPGIILNFVSTCLEWITVDNLKLSCTT